jgi:hypothetical protein
MRSAWCVTSRQKVIPAQPGKPLPFTQSEMILLSAPCFISIYCRNQSNDFYSSDDLFFFLKFPDDRGVVVIPSLSLNFDGPQVDSPLFYEYTTSQLVTL